MCDGPKKKQINPKPSNYEPVEVEGDVYDIQVCASKLYEVPMFNDVQQAKERLLNRLIVVSTNTIRPLQEKFGLAWKAPTNASEMVEAIQQKKFVLPAESNSYKNWFGIEFRDPKIVKDEEGFKVARKKIEVVYEKTADEIFILSPAEGLESFRKFESFIEKLISA